MIEYFATQDSNVWIRLEPDATNKADLVQILSKTVLQDEKSDLEEEKLSLPDGIDEQGLLAWAIEHYPESEAYQRRLQIDERISVINADLEAME